MPGLLLLAILFSCTPAEQVDWPVSSPTTAPRTRWWWPGSAVTEGGITRQLERFREAGIGGVEITPIYGAKGYEDTFVDYLSPQWNRLLQHAIAEGKRLGVGVDMPLGTGWPYGGPWVEDQYADGLLYWQPLHPDKNGVAGPIDTALLVRLIAVAPSGRQLDLAGHLSSGAYLRWQAPAEGWTVLAFYYDVRKGRKVKRAAPGGGGNCINPFSREALDRHLRVFEPVLKSGGLGAVFNDSFEWAGNWHPDFLTEFQQRNGYDLGGHFAHLAGFGNRDTIRRVKADYRRTLDELLLGEFTLPLAAWCRSNGVLLRNQAHGSPGNLIDLYAAAGIPETEIFHYSTFAVPGLISDPDLPAFEDGPDPLMMKFASSAAHLTGKPLVSSESFTWLREHFKVSLQAMKPEADQLFANGINHLFFHGTPYSPEEAPWPGWKFYASTHVAPSNHCWPQLPAFNRYLENCQRVLQHTGPDNGILLYWPIYDLWQDPEGTARAFRIHNVEEWLHPTPFGKLARQLMRSGLDFDIISDRILEDTQGTPDGLKTPGKEYKVLVVPETEFMPLSTLESLKRLAEQGATVVFQHGPPRDVPGLKDHLARKAASEALIREIAPAADPGEYTVGRGKWVITDNLAAALLKEGLRQETLPGLGLSYIRKTDGTANWYFLCNLSAKPVDQWVDLATPAGYACLLDPVDGQAGAAKVRKSPAGNTQVYLQLKPGQSLFVRTADRKPANAPWPYATPEGEPTAIGGPWTVRFEEGGPTLPGEIKTEALQSWHRLLTGDDRYFSGRAVYSVGVAKPEVEAGRYRLSVPGLAGSAVVRWNGEVLGTLFALPYEIDLPAELFRDHNALELEVCSLGANRIIYMDENQIPWKIFYDANVVNIEYRPFDASGWPLMDSGITGGVSLTPLGKGG